jgi:hypothetical protein
MAVMWQFGSDPKEDITPVTITETTENVNTLERNTVLIWTGGISSYTIKG